MSDMASNLTRNPVEALHLLMADYSRALAMDQSLGVAEGAETRTETAVGMFLSHWQLRPQAEANMENLAQYNWQQKAKAAVTALVLALREKAHTDKDEVWEETLARMAHMGFDDGAEVIASLIR